MNRGDIVAILTAAGRSSRMGRPKALLDWGGRPLIQHQVEALEGLREVIVVLGHDAEAIRPFVPVRPTVRVVENPDYQLGRTTSLLAGFGKIGGQPAGILVVAVDQPLAPTALAELFHAHRPQAPIAQPVFRGQRGHPVLFRGDLLTELLGIGDMPDGLRAVVARHRDARQEVPVMDPDILLDLNAPADYLGRSPTGPLSGL